MAKTIVKTKISSEELEQLKKGLATSSGAWNPEINEVLIGTVLSYGTKTGTYKKKEVESRFVTIEEHETGNNIKVWLKTVLESRFEELEIGVGSKVAIRYNGKVKNYHSYSVSCI